MVNIDSRITWDQQKQEEQEEENLEQITEIFFLNNDDERLDL